MFLLIPLAAPPPFTFVEDKNLSVAFLVFTP